MYKRGSGTFSVLRYYLFKNKGEKILTHIHRGWIVLLITVLNVFACLGLARFSFGVILPFMKEGLPLTYTGTGLVASAVFFGYLISAVFAGSMVKRFNEKRVIIASFLITIFGMSVSIFTYNFWAAFVACLIMGIGSGAGNVTSLSLVSKWFSNKYRGMALGITNSGSGIGMVFSGFIVPLLMVIHPEGWRISWGILAAVVLIILVINIIFLIDDPNKINVKPIGAVQNENLQKIGGVKQPHLIKDVYRNRTIILIGIIYFTWGFSYLIFSTFFVDFLIMDVKIAMNLAGRFFAIAGITSIISGFIWGSISDRIGRIPTLFIIYIFQGLILLGFAFTKHPAILMIETILYAATLWAVPTIIVALVSEITATEKSSTAIGYITLFFGIGQWISPIFTGSIVEHFNYTYAFYLSSAVCLLGSLGFIYLQLVFRKKKVFKQPIENTGKYV